MPKHPFLLLACLLLAGCTTAPGPEPATPTAAPPPPSAGLWVNGTRTVTAAATTTAFGDQYAPGGGTEPIANCIIFGGDGIRLTHATAEATWDPALGRLRLFAWTRDISGGPGENASTLGTGHARVELPFDGANELVALGVFSDGDPAVGAPVEVELTYHVQYEGASPYVGPERCTP